MRQGSMARSKSPSNATDGITLAKETFKITGNNKSFMNNRKSLVNDMSQSNKLQQQLFQHHQTFSGGVAGGGISEANMSMSMKKEYQNWQGRFEVDHSRKNS